mmetsp:Transcript_29072/g.47001  ORF Transcript_29072/g.47001 Transcript_29072/m.47001 type:complete len:90 (+) Transcript_29072:161-430(+)|eukprot:CAMPEP_0184658832 /NCGR_PEP_ID=MMETSP0308-20130426/27056_1 /TAXON_ID=38269 /ORGANISM="Gloeochaete witrockiana, Strain SAG 46.84" /LENGTH=89 /DNA_ID=CAMNT_0027098131 /DNA_START=112 /DNA_END=381 /DNA_ORIENTATION=+
MLMASMFTISRSSEGMFKDFLFSRKSDQFAQTLDYSFITRTGIYTLLDDGRFMNHASGDKANSFVNPKDGFSYARRDIAAGEELTEDYD